MSAYFEQAVAKVLLQEGGYVNNPLDTGGETNWGITRRTYESYIGRPAGPTEIINMTKGNAIAIYEKMYWNAIGGDSYNSYAIAYTIFDQAVNRGVSRALMQAQSILGIYPDGVLSNELIKRINNANETIFLEKYLQESINAYKRIVDANPSQSVFLNGWLRRVDHIKSYIRPYLGLGISVEGSWTDYLILAAMSFGVLGLSYLSYLTLEAKSKLQPSEA